MAHAYHESLSGYDPRQILFDGCRECGHRGKDVEVALANMDNETFARAWKRAYDWQASSGGGYDATGDVSLAETAVLRALWGVQVLLQRQGYTLDGDLPRREIRF
jgi:hypothetical protein